MRNEVVEIMNDIRDTSVQRDALNLQNVVDDIKFMVDKLEEINHMDYDYISAVMGKALTLLCNVDYILESYMKKPENLFFRYVKKNA